MNKKRGSGVLLHISSLPSSYGIGDLGPGAYGFADFLFNTKQSFWQILPLNPTSQACGNSPYSSVSAFAGNLLLISPDLLFRDGFLSKEDIESKPDFTQGFCDYSSVVPYKERILNRAYEKFKLSNKELDDYNSFCLENKNWLDDFALFSVMRRRYKERSWNVWDVKIRDRQPRALEDFKKECVVDLDREKFFQYVFFKQWKELKTYCNQKGIYLIGDIPIYVSYDSVDVWTNPDIFKLDANRLPTHVAGVPPDYFSETGQLWGNPVYRWDALRKDNFGWWIKRMKHNFMCFDLVRIDHFRGLVAYWEVPRGEATAVNGQWRKAPVRDFFKALFREFSDLPIIAEDLGIITPDVKKTLRQLKFPGMKVLLFAFGEDNPTHPYLPHTYGDNWVVYTGTHDNNTIQGWFEEELSEDAKERLFSYIGRRISLSELNWELIRLAMMSVANTAIFPLQDIMGLGGGARMNTPSVAKGNWQWRFLFEQLTDDISHKLLRMTQVYGRALGD